jgi:hypothetical protein
MLGPAKPRRLNQPIAVSLEELVPAGNFYRHLEAKLDLGFVHDWVRELYAERGRPSIDPVVFFKLQLIMFFEDIRSERQLIATASLNLAHRWYLGYALDEALPAAVVLMPPPRRFSSPEPLDSSHTVTCYTRPSAHALAGNRRRLIAHRGCGDVSV